MAIPTQFSVTNKRSAPIANPTQPIDNANPLTAEDVGFISGASTFPVKETGDIAAPSELTAQGVGGIDSAFLLSALSVGTINNPSIVSAEAAAPVDDASLLTTKAAPSIATPSTATAESAPSISTPSALTANTGTPKAPPFPLNHARILYDNLFQSSVITASIGSNPEYVRVPNTYQAWTAQPSAEAASITLSNFESGVVIDTICIGAHNLSEVTGTVRFETSTTDAGAFTLREERTITSNAAIMWHTETPIAIKRIRITAVNATGLFKVGYISAGIALQMQRPFFNGHQPYTDSDVTEYYAKRTESGERIGRDIRRKGFETSYEWQNLDDGWYRQYIPDFKEAVKTKPIFISWNYLEYRDDVAFGDITDDIGASMQNGTRTKRNGFGFTVVGV